jgi:hypothetical protein
MDDPAREAVLASLVRDSGASPETIEIVREKRVGDQMTAVAGGPRPGPAGRAGEPSTSP